MQFQSLSPSITVTRLRPHACQRHTEGKKSKIPCLVLAISIISVT